MRRLTVPATDWGWLISPQELDSWILQRTSDILVVNKPPGVVCHPSRYGPWSSLIGACREYLGVTRLHMPFRLDRETTGVLVLASSQEAGRRLQHAVLRRTVRKTYVAILEGELRERREVDAPIGPDADAGFFSRRAVTAEGQAAHTIFIPRETRHGYTWADVHPLTGRRHQIRVHASAIGCPIVGDKLYGRDPGVMLDCLRHGFAAASLDRLPMRRQALHAAEVIFTTSAGEEVFRAPPAADMIAFWEGLDQRGR